MSIDKYRIPHIKPTFVSVALVVRACTYLGGSTDVECRG